MGIKEDYQRDYDNSRMAEKSKKAREIGALPEIKNPERRERCKDDIASFAKTYFPEFVQKNFSADHKEVLKKIRETIKNKAKYAYAMPRGSGKSTMLMISIIWAVCYGMAKYIILITGEIGLGRSFLEMIADQFQDNDLLYEDFPELKCFRALDGEPRKQGGQTVNGKKTKVYLSPELVQMPSFEGIPSSESIIMVKSITSRIRGQLKEINGAAYRPDFCVMDDIQSDQLAASPEQVAKFRAVINKSVCCLAGPGKPMAVFFIATVIFKGDVCDTLLDHQISPDWRGKRCKLLYSLPKNLDLWENQYRQIRNQSLLEKGNIKAATAFYRKNKKAMSEGAVVAWKERYVPGREADALQHAMEIYLTDKAAFYSEYQNDPLTEDRVVNQIALDARNLTGLPRYLVPSWATGLYVGIDVGRHMASYVVLATARNFTAAVVDWGTYPQQPHYDFIYSSARNTWTNGNKTPDANIYNGLLSLFQLLLQPWKREDGKKMMIGGGLIDVGYRGKEAVIPAILKCGIGGFMFPVKGFGLPVSRKQIFEWKPSKDEIIENNMSIRRDENSILPYVLLDTNAWKSTLSQAATIDPVDPGSLRLWGTEPERHAMYYRHLMSEYPIYSSARGITIAEWQCVDKENHLLDSTVYAYAAAAIGGCKFDEPLIMQISRERRTKPLEVLS